MEGYDFNQSSNRKLAELESLVAEGKKLDFDLDEPLDKLQRIIETAQEKDLRIVLLGSFSDGKTSAIAGMLGKVENDMKIDSDESSDEIIAYHPEGMEDVKIIDTPGLFGTKEKEVDGKDVKFSRITESYISEAHIIIYVCAAVVPLKDSHAEIIRKVMRDYHKLDNTIFVINKMDEAGYDLTDNEDYKRGNEIKSQNLIKRLRETINLTPEEEQRLNIVCIAADPKGKGLLYWFGKLQDYYRRSHIQELRDIVAKVKAHSNASLLQEEAVKTSVNDILSNISEEIEQKQFPVQKILRKKEQLMPELEEDQKQLHSDLAFSRNKLRDMLFDIKNDTLCDIHGASLETIRGVIEKDLGTEDNKVTFWVMQEKVNTLVLQCCDSNAKAIDSAAVKLESAYNWQESMFTDAVAHGSKYMKNFKISGEQVKAIRDMFAKSYKFKPWGAINLGNKITKYAGWGGVLLSTGLEFYSWYKSHKDKKDLAELKQELEKVVNSCFKQLFASLTNEEEYFKNYAPQYIELCRIIKERDREIEQLRQRVNEIETYKERLDKWHEAYKGEYVDFEEV